MTFLDVGQGDAILLEDGTGLAFLVDGGPPGAEDQLIEALAARNIHQLQVVVATHPDRDHIGGLTALIQSGFPIQTILYNGLPNTSDIWTQFLQAAQTRAVPLLSARAGDHFHWGNLDILILNPPQKDPPGDDNRACLVLRVTHGSLRTLLTCDIDTQAENRLASAPDVLLPAEFLKVSHHGSDTASGSSFLQAVSPKAAILSVGPNSYGHPAPTTLSRISQAHITLWRTDVHGNVTITSTGSVFSISSTLAPPLYLPFIHKN